MPAIISNALRILNSDTFSDRVINQPTYIFIGKETAWADEDVPDTPIESEEDKINIYQDLIAVKRIQSGSISSVLPRVDWTSGEVYDQYDHRVNMVDGRKIDGSKYVFYALTDEFNVYKCLGNNGGRQSTSKPTSQQITEFQTPDGYIWKYMYTILSSDVFKYMTKNWIPVYTNEVNNSSSQWYVQESAIDGGIHNIIVDTAGIGYSSITPPTVTISGTGAGASAVAEVNGVDGSISKIIVTNPGKGYTDASLTLTDAGSGVGASVTALLSPIGGHGKDARRELGGVHKMINITLDGTENGAFPATTFRQAGLIYKVLSTDTGTKISIPDTTGYQVNDVITGGTSGATGIIRLVDSNGRNIWIQNTAGNFIQSEVITNGNESSVTEWVSLNINLPLTNLVANGANISTNSGEVLYISNRVSVQRVSTQSEEVRFVISF